MGATGGSDDDVRWISKRGGRAWTENTTAGQGLLLEVFFHNGRQCAA
jgi:hypothetical protein